MVPDGDAFLVVDVVSFGGLCGVETLGSTSR